MHISEKIERALIADGWHKTGMTDNGLRFSFTKRIENFAPAGSLSNGSRIVTLQLDTFGRWFERVDGWGKVERDVDLREFSNVPNAIKAVLQ